MKNILKITAVVALMLATTAGMANEPKISLIPGDDAKSFIFSMYSQSDAYNVELSDERGNTIFYESVLANRYSKKFNLKDLRSGTYFFSVDDPLKSAVYTLNVKRDQIQIVNEKTQTFKNVIRTVGDKVYFNLYNTDQKKVDVKITDSRNRVIYTKIFKNELIIGKVFNFENAFKDHYTIVVKDGRDTYYQKIVIG